MLVELTDSTLVLTFESVWKPEQGIVSRKTEALDEEFYKAEVDKTRSTIENTRTKSIFHPLPSLSEWTVVLHK